MWCLQESDPLLLAAEAGHEAVTRALLEHGAFVDAPDERGVTPLMRAAKQGHTSCMSLLLTFGSGKGCKNYPHMHL